MTKVITRLFESPEQALKVRRELVQQERLSVRIVHLYDTADGLSDTLTAAHVDAKTAKTYQERVGAGGAVLMVQAGYRPLAVATTTREVMARMGALDLSPLIEEVEVEDAPETRMSVLSGAPLMLSRERDPYATDFHMADWPIPLISRRKPFTYTVLPPHAKFAGWPLAHISKRKPYTGSIVGPPQTEHRQHHLAQQPDGQLALPASDQRQDRHQRADPRRAAHGELPHPAAEQAHAQHRVDLPAPRADGEFPDLADQQAQALHRVAISKACADGGHDPAPRDQAPRQPALWQRAVLAVAHVWSSDLDQTVKGTGWRSRPPAASPYAH